MTEDDSVLNAIIIACVVGIAAVAYLIMTTDRNENFTELYLLDYDKTPDNGMIFLKYGINNHENKDVNYEIMILVGNDTVKEINAFVPDNKTYVEEVPVQFPYNGTQKVSVKLDGRDEEVHFWVK